MPRIGVANPPAEDEEEDVGFLGICVAQ